MNLVIRAVSLAGQPLSQAITGYFDERGGTIGRSDTNTLALPDPERHISRLQAEITHGAGSYAVRNVGSANPIMINDRPVAPGESAPLTDGDELQVGSYLLRVSYARDNETVRTITQGRVAVDPRTVIGSSGQEPKTDPAARPAPRPLAQPAAAPATPVAAPAVPSVPPLAPTAPAHADPFADLMPAAATSSNPFADLLGGAPAPGGPAAPIAAAPAAARMAPMPPDDPPDDPFAGLASTPPPAATPLPPAPAVAAKLPDDFDPFADLMPPPAAAGSPASGSRAQAPSPSSSSSSSSQWDLPASPRAPATPPAPLPGDLDLLGLGTGQPAGGSIDQLFGLGSSTAPSADPLQAFLQGGAAEGGPPPAGAPSSLDPLALLAARPEAVNLAAEPSAEMAAPSPAPLAPATPLPDDTPELHAAMALPRPMSAAPTAAPTAEPNAAPARTTDAAPDAAPYASPAFIPERTVITMAAAPLPAAEPVAASAPVAAAPSAAPDALWSAFCAGAGVNFAPPQGLSPELMRVIGMLLRKSVDGTLKLVTARAATKHELRAQVTTIRARNNNPLKFTPDVQSALEQLLQPPLRGFMPGPQAIDDAMDDLLGHAIGTMAGMRAALDGVLERFAPDQLEAKLVGRSMLDSLLPMNRRAKLWELYLQHFEGVRTEAQEDFHTLFGKAFLQAYEDQLDRLDTARRAEEQQREPTAQQNGRTGGHA